MNYLISNQDCEIVSAQKFVVKANVPYIISDLKNETISCKYLSVNQDICCMDINFEKAYSGVVNTDKVFAVRNNKDSFCFLFFPSWSKQDFRCFEFLSKQVFVLIGENLIVNYGDRQLFKEKLSGITFKDFQIIDGLCYIYFGGDRNFLICFDKDKLIWADFYDEYNCTDDERQFLRHMNDSLNHGKVLNLKGQKVEQYLVYLDDYEMNLKPDFVALIFMDCFIAGNFNYCLKLLDDKISLNNAEDIKNFFPDCDSYFPLNACSVVLFKKNALVGICDFEINGDKICNIIVR